MELLKRFRLEIAIFVIGLIAIHLAFLPSAFRETSKIGQESAALFGDFVGGYFGTIFALCSGILLFSTLKSQIKIAQRLSFESKFHELLRLHRENVSEIKVGAVTGREFFSWAWKEYRTIYPDQHGDMPPEQNDEQKKIVIAYYCVFFGAEGEDDDIHPYVKEAADKTVWSIIPYIISRSQSRNRSDFPYALYKGHQATLGHYYRHLYQTIKYIDSQEFLTGPEKYEYAKTLRAQLSNYEQALLLTNSLTPIGRNWIKNDYLRKYKLVKNIPHGFFGSSEEHKLVGFEKGYFEWEESSTA